MAELQVLHHAAGLRGRGGHEEALGREPRGRAVVHHEAVLAQHQAVARLADRQRREGVGVDAVEERRRVGALDLDLAERRDVADADAARARRHLAVHGLEPVLLARARIILRAQPLRRSRRRPRPARPPIDARAAAASAGNPCRDDGRPARRCHRRVRRPEDRGADLGDRAAGDLGHDREAGDVRRLALVGRHAERGVALQVLDRAEALVVGERDVLGGHVVLEIDEGLRAALLDVPERRDRATGSSSAFGTAMRGDRKAAFDRRQRAGRAPSAGSRRASARRSRRRRHACRPAARRARRPRAPRSTPACR